MSCTQCEDKTECVIAGNTTVLMARIHDTEGTVLSPTDVADVTVSVYDVGDDEPLELDTYPLTLVVGDVVLGDLVTTDPRWSDSTGYNLIWKFTIENEGLYRIRMTITLTSGDTLVVRKTLQSS